MAIRFHLDEHVHGAIASGLRRRGMDVTTTAEAGLLSADDIDHIHFAIREHRVIFTQDEDFLSLAASGIEHAQAGHPHHRPDHRVVADHRRLLQQ